MSLRTKFFAMTYDRQIAGAEKAGLRAFRERLLAGASGDVMHDQFINRLCDAIFNQAVQLKFKHLCGEYCTASSFGVWMGASVLRKQQIPPVARANQTAAPSSIKTVLIVNQYMARNYSFVLLARR